MSRKLFSIILAMIVLLMGAAVSDAARAGDSLWTHNGSVMYYHARGDRRAFSYYRPRRGLERLRGEVLFTGRKRGRRIAGVAYTFKRGCRPAAYRVSGGADGRGRIVLTGAAPVRARGGCAVVGHDPASPNARLVFSYLRRVSGRESPLRAPRERTGAPLEEPFDDQSPGEERTFDPTTYFSAIFPIAAGKVRVTAVDEEEPAYKPTRVRVVIHCEGRAAPVARKEFRTCEMDGADLNRSSGLLVLKLREIDEDAGRCTRPREWKLSVGAACLGR